jgi:DNA modification methylase
MIADHQLRELEVYRKLERDLPLHDEPVLGPLVVAMRNEDLPIHRWFRFKEAYSGDLLEVLLSKYIPGNTELDLLDPFCGVGTTLLSAQIHRTRRIRAIGIEYNPFIRFAATTKLSWPDIDARRLLKLADTVINTDLAPRETIPILSGFITGRCMSHYIARRLIGIRDAIRHDGDTPNHRALLLGLAASVEPLSRTRKDGRALRLVNRPRQRVAPILQDKWQQFAEDRRQVAQRCPILGSTQVLAGDGRKLLARGIKSNSVDVVITSPPYLNNIDYSEVYKLELWLMGFVADAASFLQLRKGTLRSHPTCTLVDQEPEFLQEVTRKPLNRSFEAILAKLDTEKEKWRRKLFIGYFSDILSSLKEQYLVLRDNRLAFIIVGNSLHGGKYAPYVVATDLLICELARSVGFFVEKVSIARTLRRRLSGNHFLRESVLVLRKPNA